MTVHAFTNGENTTQFEKLVDALAHNIPCTIGGIEVQTSETKPASVGGKFLVKMTHRKHNHGELIEAVLRVRLSNDENLLGNHVDAIVQIANMEYIYKDCVYSINS